MSRAWPVLLLTIALCSCALRPAPSHQTVRYFDLGPVTSRPAACALRATRGGVRSAEPLQGTRMWYRYESAPFELIPYAISRWTAPPAQWLRSATDVLYVDAGSDVLPVLDLELLRLELVLGKDGQSRAALTIAARLTYDDDGVAQSQYALSAHADASPAGLAAAAAALMTQWRDELCAWAAAAVPDAR